MAKQTNTKGGVNKYLCARKQQMKTEFKINKYEVA
jgi:hypothetical protein